MSKIIPFSFENHPVRAITIEGDPWFVAADVCEAMCLDNNRNATARLDDEDKGVHTVDTPSGRQEMTVINESGLYSLILTSRKPEAKRFKKWVTAEVLPSIRKTGAYLAPGATLESLPPALASQIGGIIKSVVHKQIADALRNELPLLLHGEMARQRISGRHGRTAGQLWNDHKLPEKLKGAAPWFSRRLVDLKCQVDGGGCSESGGIPSKLFDPDKVAIAMKGGLLGFCKQYAQQRLGQAPLFPKG
jgi:prophage antirepressor-like protein